jgi:hypothetical protein
MVPAKLQEAVLRSFNPQQCCCGKPTAAYFRAAGTALKHVLEVVGNTDPGAAYYVGTYFRIAERMDQGAK